MSSQPTHQTNTCLVFCTELAALGASGVQSNFQPLPTTGVNKVRGNSYGEARNDAHASRWGDRKSEAGMDFKTAVKWRWTYLPHTDGVCVPKDPNMGCVEAKERGHLRADSTTMSE